MTIKLIGLTSAVLALGACAAQVEQKEDLLTAAGFTFRSANTPEAAAALKALPPHKFIHQVLDRQPVWIYADPSDCGCLYAGNDAAYQRYRQMVFQRQIADEQTEAAMMNRDAAVEQNDTAMNWAV
jgi:hypothetical protein